MLDQKGIRQAHTLIMRKLKGEAKRQERRRGLGINTFTSGKRTKKVPTGNKGEIQDGGHRSGSDIPTDQGIHSTEKAGP